MEVVTIAYVIGSESLQHEGILGMKWGHRNGPPYPLKDGAHSAAEVKANPSLARRAANATANAITKVRKGSGHEHYGRNPRRLSDDELKARIERLKREAEYQQLLGIRTGQQKQEIKMARAKAFADAYIKAFGAAVGKRVGSLGTRFGNYLDAAAQEAVKLPGKAVGAIGSASQKLGRKDRYERKLAAAKSQKEYEDWMLANNTDYFKKHKTNEEFEEDRESGYEFAKEVIKEPSMGLLPWDEIRVKK